MAVQETRNLPAQFVEDLGVDLAEQVVAQSGVPVVTTGLQGLGSMAQPTRQSFETAEQFKKRQDLFAAQQRAALGFEQRQQALAGLAPQVAGLSDREKEARRIADAGIGSFQRFLTRGEQLTGAGAGTGAGSVAEFMSPYQQQVIDTSLQAFRDSRTGNRQTIQDAAVGTGNFGGGREGAMLGQYDADTTLGEAQLLAQLNAQNFAQAQQGAQTAFTQGNQLAGAQSGLGAAQMGLSNFQRAGLGADVGALGQLGSLRQGQAQSLLSADQQAAQTAAYEPYGRLSQYGSGLTGLSGGVSAAPYAQPAPVSPMSQAIGTALGVGGLYGKIFGFPGDKT